MSEQDESSTGGVTFRNVIISGNTVTNGGVGTFFAGDSSLREEALALARDHDREAEALAHASMSGPGPARERRDLHVQAANFLRLVAEGRLA